MAIMALFYVLSSRGPGRSFLSKILLEPLDVCLRSGELHLWFVWAVRLARQNDHAGRHSLRLQRIVELVALRNRYANICVALFNHRWCGHAFHIEHRGVLLISVRLFPKLPAEIIGHERRDVRGAVEAHQIGYWCARRSRFESIGLRHDPRRHEASIAPTHHAEPFRIGYTHRDHFVDS